MFFSAQMLLEEPIAKWENKINFFPPSENLSKIKFGIKKKKSRLITDNYNVHTIIYYLHSTTAIIHKLYYITKHIIFVNAFDELHFDLWL